MRILNFRIPLNYYSITQVSHLELQTLKKLKEDVAENQNLHICLGSSADKKRKMKLYSALCLQWLLQDCSTSLMPVWIAQQKKRTAASSSGCGEGTQISFPSKRVCFSACLLLGNLLSYTEGHLFSIRIPILYLLLLPLTASTELTQAEKGLQFVVLDHRFVAECSFVPPFQFSCSWPPVFSSAASKI